MIKQTSTQPERALALLKTRGIVRLSEFVAQGITAATVRRLELGGQIERPARGLYQMHANELDPHHVLAEAARRIPKGVICLTSALAWHGLTDTIPSRVWMAIGIKDWRPRVNDIPVQLVRFGPKVLSSGIETHTIEKVPVRIYSPAKTIVDLFRYRQSATIRYKRSPGLNLAIEGLREGLRTRKATPADIAKFADEAGIWKVIEPYLDAMTAHA
jgi:predicted transcriptional regulator of viral defense system